MWTVLSFTYFSSNHIFPERIRCFRWLFFKRFWICKLRCRHMRAYWFGGKLVIQNWIWKCIRPRNEWGFFNRLNNCFERLFIKSIILDLREFIGLNLNRLNKSFIANIYLRYWERIFNHERITIRIWNSSIVAKRIHFDSRIFIRGSDEWITVLSTLDTNLRASKWILVLLTIRRRRVNIKL